MTELFWLLLPVAAASGWWVARREYAAGGLRHPGQCGSDCGLVKPLTSARALPASGDSLEEDDTETQLALGSLFRRRGEVERAVSIHSRLLATLPLTARQRSQVLLELGEDYRCAGLLDRAETLYQELVGQFEYATTALTRLVSIYEQSKDWQQAIEYSDRLEQLTGQSRRVETAHYCCEQAEVTWWQEPAQARVWLRQALSRDPACVRASLLQGRLSLEQGDYAGAITALHAVEQQDCCFLSETVSLLRQCYTALGRHAELLEYLRAVCDRERTGRVTVALADLLAQQAGGAAALTFLEAELRDRPTLLGLCCLLELQLAAGEKKGGTVELTAIYHISRQLFAQAARYRCEACGFFSKALHWQCPRCKHWSSVQPLPGQTGHERT